MRRQSLVSLAGFATALATASAVAFFATQPNFGARLGPIDDHEPLIWMGYDNHLSASEFWTTLIDKTEVGQWGNFGRFRPSYFVFRVGEAMLLGNDPWAWYACVLVLFAGACALLGCTTGIWLSTTVRDSRDSIYSAVTILGSAVGTFLFAGLYAWSGIVNRLGPSELLGLFATGVALLSLTKLSLGLARLWWIPALVGVTIAVFAKESFSSLALAFPIVGAYSYVTSGRRRVDLAAGLLGLAPAIALGLVLAPTLLRTHQDVYGGDVGSGRFGGAVSALLDPRVVMSLGAGGVLLLAWLAVATTVHNGDRRIVGFLLALVVWLFACIFLDLWFYAGNYSLPRYRAIPDLVTTLQLVGALCLSIAAIRRSQGGAKLVGLLAIVSVVVSSLCIGGLAREAASNLRATREAAILNAEKTREYDQGIEEALARGALGEPTPAVAVVATQGSDYEPAYAILNELARRSANRFREYLIVAHSSPSDRLVDALESLRERRAQLANAPGRRARRHGGHVLHLLEPGSTTGRGVPTRLRDENHCTGDVAPASACTMTCARRRVPTARRARTSVGVARAFRTETAALEAGAVDGSSSGGAHTTQT